MCKSKLMVCTCSDNHDNKLIAWQTTHGQLCTYHDASLSKNGCSTNINRAMQKSMHTILLRCNFTLVRSTLACASEYLCKLSSQILPVE